MLQFEAFLVQQGLTTPENVVKALDRQRELTQAIGKIALAQHMLTVRQVFEVLNDQADRGTKFGESAVGLHYLTEPQVGALLKIQKDGRPQTSKLLVEMGAVDGAAMEQALARYQALVQRREPRSASAGEDAQPGQAANGKL
jgi:hypothetical protein